MKEYVYIENYSDPQHFLAIVFVIHVRKTVKFISMLRRLIYDEVHYQKMCGLWVDKAYFISAYALINVKVAKITPGYINFCSIFTGLKITLLCSHISATRQ